MGISGLLPFVKKACRDGNINELAGLSVAVDASCLLHRGMFGCMDQVATGEETNFYIYYVRKYIKTLLDQKCHVVMVFDGRRLPAKKDTNAERQARREENLSQGHALLSQGKVDEASEKFKRATHITREVVESTVKFFRSYRNVDIIVAPYEADAELAYLSREGLVDAVITQDSDLIVFGCEKIFFKWEHASGSCLIYDRSCLEDCFPTAFKFTFEKFRRVCILAGCDYLQAGLPGVGINKALTFLTKTSQTNPRLMLKKIPTTLRMPKLRVSDEFVEEFIKAENTFLHQVIFDPISRTQQPLTPYPINSENNENFNIMADDSPIHTYAGEVVNPKSSVRLALGNHIDCKGVLEDVFLLSEQPPHWSVWNDQYKSLGTIIRHENKLEKRKQPNNNAIQFDFAENKRVMTPKVQATTTCNGSIQISATAKKSTVTRRLRNEATLNWTVDDMLRLYSSQPLTSSSQNSPFTQQSGSSQSPDRKRKYSADERDDNSDTKDSCDLFSDPESLTDTIENNVHGDSLVVSDVVITRTKEITSSAQSIANLSRLPENPFKKDFGLAGGKIYEPPKRKYRSVGIASQINDVENKIADENVQKTPTSRQTVLTNIRAFGFRSAGLRKVQKESN
ncbi:unnamed protein product, partial [Mesorhabditis belari]|uniref:Exonuclease 1 n=1 Tax=Mesorhabditis belari TaxID=2138241 RepID=A0AAF3E917_9BILA